MSTKRSTGSRTVAVLFLALLPLPSCSDARDDSGPETELDRSHVSPEVVPERAATYRYPSQPGSDDAGPPDLTEDEVFRVSTLRFRSGRTEKTTVQKSNGRSTLERYDPQGVLRVVEIREPGSIQCVTLFFDGARVLREVCTYEDRPEKSEPAFEAFSRERAGWFGYLDERGTLKTTESGVYVGNRRSKP